MIDTGEMIYRFKEQIGIEKFEEIELEDYSKIDEFAESIGYVFKEEENTYVKR